MAGDGLAGGVELQQLLGHVAHRLLDARLRLFPRRAAEPVERRAGGAGELLDEVEPLDRDEELVLAGVAELHELLVVEADRDPFQADEQADAVVDVDDEVAGLQIAEVREERPGGRAAALVDLALFLEDVGLGPELQLRLRQAEAAAQMTDADQHRGGMAIVRALDRHREDVVVGEQLDRPLGAAGGMRDEDHRVAALAAAADLVDPVGHAAGELHRRLARDVDRVRHRRARGVSSAVAPDSHERDGVPLQQQFGRRRRALVLSRLLPGSWLDLVAQPCGPGLDLVRLGDEQRRLGRRDVVDDGGGAVEIARDRPAVPAAARSRPDRVPPLDRCVAGS